MRTQYVYEINVRCACCAQMVEKAISEIDGVISVSVSSVNGKMYLETEEERSEEIMKNVDEAARRVDPSFVYRRIEEEKEEEDEEEDVRWLIPRVAVGAVFMLLGLLIEYGIADPGISDLHMRIIYLAVLLFVGYSTFLAAVRNLVKAKFLDENFLMSVSTLGALAVGYWTESLAVMVFYLIGEWFEDRAVEKTRRNVRDLLGLKVAAATVMRDGKAVKVDPSDVKVGEAVVVGPGEVFPLDGTVVEGDGYADTKAISGEPVPRHVTVGDRVLSGFINTEVALLVRADRPYRDSTVKRMFDLIEQSSARKSRSEKFITRFARYYTPAVVLCAAALATVPCLIWPGEWSDWVYRAMIFLVVSCPCALVISVPLTYFCGIGGASKNGILVKGGSYIETLSKVDRVVFDKTGTLTEGEFRVSSVDPAEGFTEEQVVDLAACAEAFSSHPIGRSICAYADRDTDPSRIEESVNIPGRGVRASVDDRAVYVGSHRLMEDIGVQCQDLNNDIGTDIFVAVDGRFAGHILISDDPKADSREAVAMLRRDGVRTYMLTGDRLRTAKAVSEDLGLDDFAAEMLPEGKTRALEAIMEGSAGRTAFVGDGINDAPSLARADVGIAMGGVGSDAAIEAADVVILNDSPVKVADARRMSKKTQRIVTENIVFALAVKFAILALTPLGLVNMWMAIFGDVGVLILCVVNSVRALGPGHGRVPRDESGSGTRRDGGTGVHRTSLRTHRFL